MKHAPHPPRAVLSDATTAARPGAIVIECELAESPEKVWQALTIPELLAAWLMPNDIRPEKGARFSFEESGPGASGDAPQADHGPARRTDQRSFPGRIDCTVLDAEPRRLLRYSWRAGTDTADPDGRPLDTIVTFELFPTASGGTLLRLIHSEPPAQMQAPMALLACRVGALRAHLGWTVPGRRVKLSSLRRAA